MSAQVDALHDSRMLNFETTPYWQAYGLHEDPFAMELDSRMYYASPHWEEYIDLLQYLCHYNNDLLVIAGVSGSGKSTLINEFIAQVDDTMRTCYTSGHAKLTPTVLLDILSDGFELSKPCADPLEEQLDTYLEDLQECDRTCVLAIDNAHTLPADTLRTLLYLVQQQSENHMRLHILLLGEPQVQMALLRIADAQGYERDQIHNLTLEPFSLDETKQYLKHRLTVAGLTGELPLSEETIKRIYKLSEGIPGRINRIVRRTLVNEMPQPELEESPSWFYIHRYKLCGGAILAGLVITLGSLLNSANQEDGLVAKKQELPTIAFQNESTAIPAVATTPATEPTPAVTTTPVSQDSTQQAAPLQTAPMQTQAIPPVQNTSVEPQTMAPAPTAIAPAEPTPTVTPTPEAAVIPEATPKNWQQNELQAITSSTQAAQPATPKKPKPVQQTQSATAPTESIAASAEKLEQPNSASSSAEIIATPAVQKTVAKKAPVSKSSVQPLTNDEKRLLDIPAERYTLQLIGLSSAKTARQFISQHNLTNKVSYFRSALKGKPLYVLVYGEYETPQQAKEAIPNLPTVVQKLRPWPRSMKVIHETIKGKTPSPSPAKEI